MQEVDEPDLTPVSPAGAATEEDLGGLHAGVCRALTEVVTEGVPIVDKDGEVVGKAPAPAAYLGAAIAFLKNNNITASPSKNKDLAALKEALGKKRQRKELKPRDLQAAADEFERMQGSNGLMQ